MEIKLTTKVYHSVQTPTYHSFSHFHNMDGINILKSIYQIHAQNRNQYLYIEFLFCKVNEVHQKKRCKDVEMLSFFKIDSLN